MDHLLRHPWPGNIRELMNAVERGVVLSQGKYLDETDLALLTPESAAAALFNLSGTAASLKTADEAATAPPQTDASRNGSPRGGTAAGKADDAGAGAGTASLEMVEKETILRTLSAAGGNKSEAARRLGITRRTLHQKLRKYGVM
jgi:two-component system response regulator HydG